MSISLNTIYVYFKGKHQVRSKPQYQYNREQYLYFMDLDLPEVFEVHFSNGSNKKAKPQLGRNNKVLIPDEYFWSGESAIYAWVYLHNGKDDGKTVYEVIIPLIERGKPTSDDIAPVDRDIITDAIAELNYAIDEVNRYANEAEEFRNQSAENVERYPRVINGYWSIWDASAEQYVSTGVKAQGETGMTVFADCTNFIIPVVDGKTIKNQNVNVKLYAYQGDERKPVIVNSVATIYYYNSIPVGLPQEVPSYVIDDIQYGVDGILYNIPTNVYFNTQVVTCDVVVDGVTYPITLSFNAIPIDATAVITVDQPTLLVPTDRNGKLKTAYNRSITFTISKGTKLISAEWSYNGYEYNDSDGLRIYNNGTVGYQSSSLDVYINIPANCTIVDCQHITATAKVSNTETYTYTVPLVAIKQGDTGDVTVEQLNEAITLNTNDLKQYINMTITNAINNFGDALFENA